MCVVWGIFIEKNAPHIGFYGILGGFNQLFKGFVLEKSF